MKRQQVKKHNSFNRKFQRTSDRSSIHSQRRSVSPNGKDQKLSKFYVPLNKIKRENTVDSQNEQKFDYLICKNSNLQLKQENGQTAKNWNQGQNLQDQLQKLKQRNKQLELKLKVVTKTLNDHLNKENSSMNKMRDKTQKQRFNELEMQNSQLKALVKELNEEIKQLKSQKSCEETSCSVLQQQSQMEIQIQSQLEVNERQIFGLNQTVKKLQIQMDFLNRRNHTELNALKFNYQKQFKVMRANGELKKKNIQLNNQLKRRKNILCQCPRAERNLKRNNSLLSLSSD